MSKYDTEISYYLNLINRQPVLSHEEQIDLVKKAQKGDKNARNKLVESNLRFVVNTAKAYQNQGLDLIDLIQEGNIGLISAVKKFDVNSGHHFITYAVWWIRQGILKALTDSGRAIRLPQHKANEVLQIEKARRMMSGLLTERQELQELGKILNMSEPMIKELLLLSQEMASLDAAEEGADAPLGSTLSDNIYGTPEEDAINATMKSDIEKELKTLKSAEAKVIELRYGLKDGQQRSLSEVGKICNLTKERIRQIEQSAFVRLRAPNRAKKLYAYIEA